MGKRTVLTIMLTLIAVVTPTAIFASNDLLASVYARRTDLQSAFDPVTFKAKAGTKAGFIIDLKDWAQQYGWKELPELREFGPKQGDGIPVRVGTKEIEDQIGAEAYLVMDRSTGTILTVKQENKVWPIASLTKLVTSEVVLDHKVPTTTVASVKNSDNVGGAKLAIVDGDTFSVDDLFYATLIASANNAANALSRTTGLSKESFVKEMNEKAIKLNLVQTAFVDPTGIELGNVSTAREFSRLAREIFDRSDIRRYITTSHKDIHVINQGTTKKMTSTNWMLYKPEYDDVWVTGGKTGYLEESGWNLVESLRPSGKDHDRELLLVIFGADSRASSFADAQKLAHWAWENYNWQQVN